MQFVGSTFQGLAITLHTTRFKIKKILPGAHTVFCVFCINLRTNSGFCLTQRWGFNCHNWDWECLQHGMHRVLIQTDTFCCSRVKYYTFSLLHKIWITPDFHKRQFKTLKVPEWLIDWLIDSVNDGGWVEGWMERYFHTYMLNIQKDQKLDEVT